MAVTKPAADAGPADYRILPDYRAAQRAYTSAWPELSPSARAARRAEATQRMHDLETAYERGDLADEIAGQVAAEKWADNLAGQLPPLAPEEVRAVGAIAKKIDDRSKAQTA